MNDTNKIADESCLTTTYKSESYFWKSSLNENVETQCKRCRNLVRFGVWGQITQLVRKTKLSPSRAEQRGLSYFTQFHSELTQCIAENFLPQRFASESHTSHFWSGSLSFVISHHIASGAWSHRISLFSHVFGLIWASPFPWIIIYVGLGMRITRQSQTLWVAPGIGSQS